MSTAGASILAVGYLLPLTYLSGRCGGEKSPAIIPSAPRWNGETSSAAATFKLDETPVVTHEAYAYDKIRGCPFCD
jgi:cytochrome c oxidase subunit 1